MIYFIGPFLSNCTPHATEAFSPIDHQSRGLWGPSYRGSSAGVSGCLSMFHTIVIGWSPVASHFNLTTSPLRAVSLRNLFSKRGGTEIKIRCWSVISKFKFQYIINKMYKTTYSEFLIQIKNLNKIVSISVFDV